MGTRVAALIGLVCAGCNVLAGLDDYAIDRSAAGGGPIAGPGGSDNVTSTSGAPGAGAAGPTSSGSGSGASEILMIEEDTFLSELRQGVAKGSEPALELAGMDPGRLRPLLRFVAGNLAGCRILSADLKLTLAQQSPVDEENFTVHAVTVSWTEAATWAVSDGITPWPAGCTDDCEGDEHGSKTIAADTPDGTPISVSLGTSLLEGWIGGSNNGIILVAAPSGNVIRFHARNTDDPPRVEVTCQ